MLTTCVSQPHQATTKKADTRRENNHSVMPTIAPRNLYLRQSFSDACLRRLVNHVSVVSLRRHLRKSYVVQTANWSNSQSNANSQFATPICVTANWSANWFATPMQYGAPWTQWIEKRALQNGRTTNPRPRQATAQQKHFVARAHTAAQWPCQYVPPVA